MAELLCDDIYEKVFIILDVRTLIRCKGVCKSWKSFITGSRFVKAHLKCSYNRNEHGHKRIGRSVFRIGDNGIIGHSLIGSSNGLVCISDDFDCDNGYWTVGNPSTREVRTVTMPRTWISCSGFGYDSLTDDYKVVIGSCKFGYKTCFRVFSLKKNAWKVIGDVNYTTFEPCGVLCNGAIHWVIHPTNNKVKQVILSFDLSKEEFKEIPQPDDARRKYGCLLGIMEECLCINSHPAWVMKKCNDIQYWQMLPDNCKIKVDFGYDFKEVRPDHMSRPGYWFIGNRQFSGCPNIVESLVSPHLLADNE